MTKMTIDKSQFPVLIPITVAWGEMDAFGHVNNTVYFRYFETARIGFFRNKIPESDRNARFRPILAKTDCTFIRPIFFPDKLLTGVAVGRVEKDRFTMQHAIFQESTGACMAKGSGTIVCFDYVNQCKADIPPDWLAILHDA